MFVGVFGSFVFGVLLFDVDQGVFFDKIVTIVKPNDVWNGLQKAFAFAVVIATLSCQFGLNAGGGAKGVGMATTNSVVVTFLVLLAVDFFITYVQIVF
jgi:phospholipid/cholesterol/gamma-HCH transport system permease protein